MNLLLLSALIYPNRRDLLLCALQSGFQRALCQAILVPIAAQLFYGENREV
jgi:hypothetical protein